MDKTRQIHRTIGAILIILVVGAIVVGVMLNGRNKPDDIIPPGSDQSTVDTVPEDTQDDVVVKQDVEWEAVIDENAEYFFERDAQNNYKWTSNNKGQNNTTATQTWKITVPDKLEFVEYIYGREVSAQAFSDYFTLTLDGEQIVNETKSNGLLKTVLNLTPGEHTLTASFSKDMSSYSGSDSATLYLEPLTAETINKARQIYANSSRWTVADNDLNYYFEQDGNKWVPNNTKTTKTKARTELTITIPEDKTYEITYHVFNTNFLFGGNSLTLVLDGETVVTAENDKEAHPTTSVELSAGMHTLELIYVSTDSYSADIHQDETYVELKPVF